MQQGETRENKVYRTAIIFNTYARGYMYKLVNELGRLCGIADLHYHQSRHCFGTHITLSMGVPIETVSRMMGRTRRSTTEIYAKVTDKKVDEDMKRLRKRTADNPVSLYEDEKLRAAIRFPGAKRAGNNTRTANGQ